MACAATVLGSPTPMTEEEAAFEPLMLEPHEEARRREIRRLVKRGYNDGEIVRLLRSA